MTKVVNVYREQFDIYIGRANARFGAASKFANPFWMKDESQREVVIENFRQHLYQQIKEGKITKKDLLALEGKRLGCYCSPKACHGDVIIRAIQWAKENL